MKPETDAVALNERPSLLPEVTYPSIHRRPGQLFNKLKKPIECVNACPLQGLVALADT